MACTRALAVPLLLIAAWACVAQETPTPCTVSRSTGAAGVVEISSGSGTCQFPGLPGHVDVVRGVGAERPRLTGDWRALWPGAGA
jgi:hypothetical protein